jgi:hypothetical protein
MKSICQNEVIVENYICLYLVKFNKKRNLYKIDIIPAPMLYVHVFFPYNNVSDNSIWD